MKQSRHEKAIRAELQKVEAEVAVLTDEVKRAEAERDAAYERQNLLEMLLNLPPAPEGETAEGKDDAQ